MRKLPIGNDQPIRWAVTVSGKPFNLEGQDVHVYVVNSRGEIPLRSLKVKGAEVSGVFEGRYQTRLGEHSLILRVNEGRPEMKTASVANVFELVKWSADAGGSDEGDVIITPVILESELSIGGVSYDDTELREAIKDLEEKKVNNTDLATINGQRIDEGGNIEIEASTESSVFEAVYGETTYDEIVEAYNDGKWVVCIKDDVTYHIIKVEASRVLFVNINTTVSSRLTCGNNNNKWGVLNYYLEDGTNKTNTLSSASTDTQYPSAKAVYDFVRNSKDVFYAEYGVTTYDEIVAAHNEGKNVLCIYNNNNIARLTRILESVLYLFVIGANAIRLSCFKGGTWSYNIYNFSHELKDLDNGNVQVTIAGKSAEVATPQYVENLLGTIINGDY